MKTAVCTDLHIGYKDSDVPKYTTVVNFLGWCNDNKIGMIVMTESYEMLWSRGWILNDIVARDTLDEIKTVAKSIPAIEITGNHFLEWQHQTMLFPFIRFRDEIEVDGWHIEHGHRLDPVFYLQKPWYWIPKWIKRNPATPWEAKAKDNEKYKKYIEDIRRNYKCLSLQIKQPVIIGHTHSQEDASNLLTGTRLVNLGALHEDKVFLTIDNGKVEIHRLD